MFLLDGLITKNPGKKCKKSVAALSVKMKGVYLRWADLSAVVTTIESCPANSLLG
jgi:hypothetical protein